MAFRDLPMEIIDQILSHISAPLDADNAVPRRLNHVRLYGPDEMDAKKDLASCSLVCRSMGVLTRTHLFFTTGFFIDPDDDAPGESRKRPLFDGSAYIVRSLSGVLELIWTTPKIFQCVRRLRLITTTAATQSRLPVPELADCDPRVLYDILHSLPSLHSLELVDTFIRTRTSLAHADCLHLNRLSFILSSRQAEERRVDDLLGLLCLFGRVTDLRLDRLLRFKPWSRPDIPEQLQVKSLIIEGSHRVCDILRALPSTATIEARSLNSLDLGYLQQRDFDALCKVLKSAAPSCEHLALHLHPLPLAASDWSRVMRAANEGRLRSLRLKFDLDPRAPGVIVGSIWGSIASALSPLVPTNDNTGALYLDTVGFTMSMDRSIWEWVGIRECVLALGQLENVLLELPALRVVEIFSEDSLRFPVKLPPSGRDAFQDVFPRLRARDILQC